MGFLRGVFQAIIILNIYQWPPYTNCLQFPKPHMYADDILLSAASELTLEVLPCINQDFIDTTN